MSFSAHNLLYTVNWRDWMKQMIRKFNIKPMSRQSKHSFLQANFIVDDERISIRLKENLDFK